VYAGKKILRFAQNDKLKGNTAQCGKSRFRENLSSDDGTFSQMYFVYLKKK